MSRERWDSTIEEMIRRNAMPEPDAADRRLIVDYLAATFPPRTRGGTTRSRPALINARPGSGNPCRRQRHEIALPAHTLSRDAGAGCTASVALASFPPLSWSGAMTTIPPHPRISTGRRALLTGLAGAALAASAAARR
jgi:hypothetical protein